VRRPSSKIFFSLSISGISLETRALEICDFDSLAVLPLTTPSQEIFFPYPNWKIVPFFGLAFYVASPCSALMRPMVSIIFAQPSA
jgi:hypothetical protein